MNAWIDTKQCKRQMGCFAMRQKKILCSIVLLGLLLCSQTFAAERVALIIGNSNYRASPLNNPANDANDMADVLRRIEFDVIVRTNADKKTIVDALRVFGRELETSRIGLFYYAGHGMQIDGINYLIPVNNGIKDVSEIEFEAINAGRILARMETAGNPMNILILDACRDNPFKTSFRTSAKGLAKMDAPPGTIIAYATSPGSVSEDGRGRNGTYTESLLKRLQQTDLHVRDMFNKTGLDVMNQTHNKQIPWVSTSPIPDYYLAGKDLNVVSPLPAYDGTASTPSKTKLFVTTSPSDCKVRILNILPVFYNGMELDPGHYKIEVSKKGFKTRIQWVDIRTTQRKDLFIALDNNISNNQNSWKDPVTGMRFVWIPKGCFMMGSNGGKPDEKPIHKACVNGFWMAEYEVTKEQFNRFIEETRYKTDAQKKGAAFLWTGAKWERQKGYDWKYTNFYQTEFHPVVNVSWNDANAFANWLSQKHGRTFRLPTETQWEYAARGGGKDSLYSGSSRVDHVAWHSANSKKRTHAVGEKAPNAFGLFDMSGNVWEWCQDAYDTIAYLKKSKQINRKKLKGTEYVLRGGSWNDEPRYVRTTVRNGDHPGASFSDYGFRLVMMP